MTAPEIEVKFTQALTGVSEEHIAQAKRKAQEAFVMELLRLGEISAGRAARLLGVQPLGTVQNNVQLWRFPF
jgi:hypothetical protein